MFKTRQHILEEEAKKDPNYIPSKNLKAEGDDIRTYFPWKIMIFVFVMLALIIGCIIAIMIIQNNH